MRVEITTHTTYVSLVCLLYRRILSYPTEQRTVSPSTHDISWLWSDPNTHELSNDGTKTIHETARRADAEIISQIIIGSLSPPFSLPLSLSLSLSFSLAFWLSTDDGCNHLKDEQSARTKEREGGREGGKRRARSETKENECIQNLMLQDGLTTRLDPNISCSFVVYYSMVHQQWLTSTC